MAGNEIDISYQWMQATLTGDSTLAGYAPGGVWRAGAPDGTTAPYVTITFLPGQSRDELVFGGRAFSELYFDILAAGPATSLQAITSAATRIDSLLTTYQATSITGGTLISCYRSMPHNADPLVSGAVWNATGGTYCIRIKAS